MQLSFIKVQTDKGPFETGKHRIQKVLLFERKSETVRVVYFSEYIIIKIFETASEDQFLL